MSDGVYSPITGYHNRRSIWLPGYEYSPPEVLGDAIAEIMAKGQKGDEDHNAILEILKSAGRDHELKSILRVVSEMKIEKPKDETNPVANAKYANDQGDTLQAGALRIRSFLPEEAIGDYEEILEKWKIKIR
jgi:hypothetical protein